MRNNKLFIIVVQIILSINLVTFCFAQEKSREKILLDECMGYYKTGEYERAINCYLDVIKTSLAGDALLTAYVYLSYTYYTIGKKVNTENYLTKAIFSKPNIKLEKSEFESTFIDFFKDIKNKYVGVGSVVSIPSGALVYFDNRKMGSTPFKDELLAKKYLLRLVKLGYSSVEMEIQIRNNEINEFSIDFSKKENWKTFLRSSLVMVVLHYLLDFL